MIKNLQIAKLNIGDTFYFGQYSPTEVQEKQPIEWQVLDKQENRILVLSRYILDAKPFHAEEEITRWEESSLRLWLNEEFYQEAFSEEEKEWIDYNEEFEDPDGEFLWKMLGLETITSGIPDAVFLLNCTDMDTYFPGEDSFHDGASTEMTELMKNTAEEKDYYENCWWLRSSMTNWSMAFIVSPCDSIGVSAVRANNVQGVRPAMWLKINKE